MGQIRSKRCEGVGITCDIGYCRARLGLGVCTTIAKIPFCIAGGQPPVGLGSESVVVT